MAATSGRLMLRLYVAGHAPNSTQAIENLTAICEANFPGRHDLEVVDILQDALRALADAVIVTPTLLKLQPAPAERIIGNLSDTEQVMLALGGR